MQTRIFVTKMRREPGDEPRARNVLVALPIVVDTVVQAFFVGLVFRETIAALVDLSEIRELSYEDHPPALFAGFVHSFEKGPEECAEAERFAMRRIDLARPLDDFFFDQS